MIPYFHPPNLSLGPLTIEPFGMFAALGIYLTARLLAGRAKRDGLDPEPLLDFTVWAVVIGVISGHLVHLLLYHPKELQKSPYQILKVWDGLSSFGGLLGGVIAGLVYFKVKKLPLMRYMDVFALGMPPGWAIARLGCFAVHDHPGVKTDFFLAVQFPGGARHDLGLYDAIALFVISAVVWTLAHKGLLNGRLLAVVAILYGVQRFGTDFLRAYDLAYVDARYAGLTPGQYFCIALVGWGIWKLASFKPEHLQAEAAQPQQPQSPPSADQASA
ncbi:MAG: prolipoprotein diacylglyceryl transferase [Myxococcales bacterium]